MAREPLIDDDGEAREATEEDFANARIGDPDIILPVTLPREHVIQRARENAAQITEHIAAGGRVSRRQAEALRNDVRALLELVGEPSN
ncbi:MAG: hypothetical protein AAF580_12015 [Pseudomonadota bacterium]